MFLGLGLADLEGNVLELIEGSDGCGKGLWCTSSSSFSLLSGPLPCLGTGGFLAVGGPSRSFLSCLSMAGGKGGFCILGKCSLPSGAEGLSENVGFFPSMKGSRSRGANERSKGGFVLLSIDGAGNFAVLRFRLLLGSSWLGWGEESGE